MSQHLAITLKHMYMFKEDPLAQLDLVAGGKQERGWHPCAKIYECRPAGVWFHPCKSPRLKRNISSKGETLFLSP